MGSGALRSRLIKLSSESRNPSVWRSGRPKTTRSVNAVRIARFEYRRCPPRRPFFGGIHAAIASSLSQIVTSPRLLRPRSYSLQFRDSVLRLVLAVDSARLPCGHDVAPLISRMDRNPPPMLACPLTPIHAPMPFEPFIHRLVALTSGIGCPSVSVGEVGYSFSDEILP